MLILRFKPSGNPDEKDQLRGKRLDRTCDLGRGARVPHVDFC
jgi:hypothetical protein